MERGVMIAADQRLQTLIPVWHAYYRRVMDLPVAFVDLGIDEKYVTYCRRHFHYIRLEHEEKNRPNITEEQAEIWENFTPCNSKLRNAWFKKPLACQLTPFMRTLWLDVDCAVLEPVNELFDKEGEILALVAEDEEFQIMMHMNGLTAFDETTYNSGVILFDRSSPVMQLWAEKTKAESHLFMGDQNLLSRIIYETEHPVERLPTVYNHLVRLKKQEGIKILHYAGPKKIDMPKDLLALLNKDQKVNGNHDLSGVKDCC